MRKVTLKEGREKSLFQRHPWIFSGAISEMPLDIVSGEILPVYSFCGKLLASAYFHKENSIAGRVLSFGDEPAKKALARNLHSAIALRKKLFETQEKMGLRLINAEGDGIPGLVVDQYDQVIVIQVTTCGIERLKEWIVGQLITLLNPRTIFEKSASAARRQEGLEDFKGVIYGKPVTDVEIVENGISYRVNLLEGQKTGFFLDQRQMRKKIASLSLDRRVLNCFAYTGGFSAAALKGGALLVDSVEISEEACRLCRLNGKEDARHRVICEDVFTFLERASLEYDLVILDPPAFAKKRADVEAACRGYKEINRKVMQKAASGTLLLTSSCSSYIDEDLFQNVIFQAALEAGRFVRIVGRHEQASDHPVALNHPEGAYLKSLLLLID